MNKKLFLLDAYALIYRAYFAFSNSPRINSNGLNTSAIFGFTNTVLDIIKKEQPSHIGVVFDTSAPTHRHIEFEAYKAHREEMPEDLRKAIPYIYKLLEALNIPAIEMDGFEADDIIGTLAKRAEENGFITYMMTPDKDFGQLVSTNIFIYKPGYKGGPPEKLGLQEICAKYGIVRADQVIDILGLMGDTADNIPGIRGVGEKTALNLIHEYGTIENILNNTAKLKGKLKEKVENGKEDAILSRMLATIILDVPIPFDEELLRSKEIHKDKVKTLFTELEFRRLSQLLLGEDIIKEVIKEKEFQNEIVIQEGPSKKTKPGQLDIFGHTGTVEEENETTEKINYETIETVKHNYKLIENSTQRAALIVELSKLKQFCFDTETTGLDTMTAELVGLSFSWEATEACYVPIPAEQTEAQLIIDEFKTLFANELIGKTGQNIKYDMNVLKNYGVAINGILFDTMIAHYLLQPDMRHGMDALAGSYLNYAPVSIETLIGKRGKNQISMRDVAVEKIMSYAAEDADITWQLQNVFSPLLKEANAQKLFDEVEMPLVPVLAAMEREGIAIDTETLKKYSTQLATEISVIELAIQNLAGTPFNISSPKQVGDILFEVLKISAKPKKTKTGQYATGEDILQKLIKNHPIIEKILEYREMMKLKNTYVDTLPEMMNVKTGRIHTSYNQVVAATGRLSSDNPNLQNIPVRTARGREIRKAFIPKNNNYVLMSADYSQIELRIVASICGDENMCAAFRDGKDIHTATAARVYGIAESEVTKEMRYKAKSVNFGIIYGQGAFGLAENLGISRGEAKELIENYFREYPGVKKYMDDTVNFAREYGYVQTILGRRRYLSDILSTNAVVRGFAERNAINAPIQGSAADMIKVAMINVQAALIKNKFETKLLLQVHDELVFDVPENEVEIVKPVIEAAMINALKLNVPIEVGIGVGKNWLEAH
ncbi:MAG: DNA polymerase I [Flavobacteriales bacterium]|nr:MAG: DNA polymerase I [Flavobacteriales bacterium]